MFYVLEFFSLDERGDKHKLLGKAHESRSVDHAISYARAVLKNVAIQGRKPDLCLVKNQGGTVLSALSANHLTINVASHGHNFPTVLIRKPGPLQ
jgi:hypothetical protein